MDIHNSSVTDSANRNDSPIKGKMALWLGAIGLVLSGGVWISYQSIRDYWNEQVALSEAISARAEEVKRNVERRLNTQACTAKVSNRHTGDAETIRVRAEQECTHDGVKTKRKLMCTDGLKPNADGIKCDNSGIF